MGMAASQARLLSITSRMADNELRAQLVNNSKMRLAADSSQASTDYVNALNNATMMFTNYDAAGNDQYQKLNFNNLSQYSSYNTQYGLTNAYGQLLVSEHEAELYKAANGNLENYLELHGLKKDTTYFSKTTFGIDADTIDLEYYDAESQQTYKLGNYDIEQLKTMYYGGTYKGVTYNGYADNTQVYEEYLRRAEYSSKAYNKLLISADISGKALDAYNNIANDAVIAKITENSNTTTNYTYNGLVNKMSEVDKDTPYPLNHQYSFAKNCALYVYNYLTGDNNNGANLSSNLPGYTGDDVKLNFDKFTEAFKNTFGNFVEVGDNNGDYKKNDNGTYTYVGANNGNYECNKDSIAYPGRGTDNWRNINFGSYDYAVKGAMEVLNDQWAIMSRCTSDNYKDLINSTDEGTVKFVYYYDNTGSWDYNKVASKSISVLTYAGENQGNLHYSSKEEYVYVGDGKGNYNYIDNIGGLQIVPGYYEKVADGTGKYVFASAGSYTEVPENNGEYKYVDEELPIAIEYGHFDGYTEVGDNKGDYNWDSDQNCYIYVGKDHGNYTRKIKGESWYAVSDYGYSAGYRAMMESMMKFVEDNLYRFVEINLDSNKEPDKTILKFMSDYGLEQKDLSEAANLYYQLSLNNDFVLDEEGNPTDTLNTSNDIAAFKSNELLKRVQENAVLDAIFDNYGEPKEGWIVDGNPAEDANPKVQWFTNIFNKIQKAGYSVLENGLASSNEWIQFALESGLVNVEQVDKQNTWNATLHSNIATITEITDDVAVARAEAKYKKTMNDIENKDKRLDIELKNIDTEHNALQTEYESVKNVISKNIERSFKMYNA